MYVTIKMEFSPQIEFTIFLFRIHVLQLKCLLILKHTENPNIYSELFY